MATPFSLSRNASGVVASTSPRSRPDVFRRSATKKARAVVRWPPNGDLEAWLMDFLEPGRCDNGFAHELFICATFHALSRAAPSMLTAYPGRIWWPNA